MSNSKWNWQMFKMHHLIQKIVPLYILKIVLLIALGTKISELYFKKGNLVLFNLFVSTNKSNLLSRYPSIWKKKWYTTSLLVKNFDKFLSKETLISLGEPKSLTFLKIKLENQPGISCQMASKSWWLWM